MAGHFYCQNLDLSLRTNIFMPSIVELYLYAANIAQKSESYLNPK